MLPDGLQVGDIVELRWQPSSDFYADIISEVVTVHSRFPNRAYDIRCIISSGSIPIRVGFAPRIFMSDFESKNWIFKRIIEYAPR